ncbi:MAG: 5'-deoxynucleotidase [Defluviitaleaceae bacterium]|nr:5'-deoxynucleotidase [Defluviitaleaceae bacterium]
MKNHNFLAMIFRMKNINRWGLMYNTYEESLTTHTLECAFISHMLCTIGNLYYNKNYDADKVACYSLYHDATEIITGDLPTPIKYYNQEIKNAYKKIEKEATKKLLELLPTEISNVYEHYLNPGIDTISTEELKIIKIADTLCAYIKCSKEISNGNNEFLKAKNQIKEKLDNYKSEELSYFMDNFLHTFNLSLDELEK